MEERRYDGGTEHADWCSDHGHHGKCLDRLVERAKAHHRPPPTLPVVMADPVIFDLLVRCTRCKVIRTQHLTFTDDVKGYHLHPCISPGLYGAQYCDGEQTILSIR